MVCRKIYITACMGWVGVSGKSEVLDIYSVVREGSPYLQISTGLLLLRQRIIRHYFNSFTLLININSAFNATCCGSVVVQLPGWGF